jgi:hypothetical protein
MQRLFPLLIAATSLTAGAQTPQTLERVEVNGLHYDNTVGSSDAASAGAIRSGLLKSRPALRPAEVLEFVPGMIVTQHSGDGKANQYFLRGFNLDHGTDFATRVGGLPVNMPSHGHGQGYTDLNFLIPELVERIDYRKGPYDARNGDFASAGSADIAYRASLAAPLAQISLGQNGYRRALLGASPSGDSLLALELQGDEGPWTLAEKLRKANAVASLSGGDAATGWRADAQAYRAQWRASDQVPERALSSGEIGRFGTVDPTTGGHTHRLSLGAEWHGGGTKLAAYLIDYELQLWSNFTYALERPATGDQFEQSDRRQVAGLSAEQQWQHTLGGLAARTEVGAQWRGDRARVGLYDTQARQRLATTRDDRLRLHSAGLWAQTAVQLAPRWRSVLGLRADRAEFNVNSLSEAANSGRAGATQLSPKFSLIAGPWAQTEFFLNAGRGLHSNDARGTTARLDPKTGEPVERVAPLVASRGWELGARSEWLPGLQTSLALWRLDFDSELVYVGDAGATEPNRPSKRHGLEWNNRWAPTRWLLLDADLAWTQARFADADPAGNRIPNAVDRVASVAATVRELGAWSASLQWRYLGSGALIENNSVRSRSSATANLRLARQFERVAGLHGFKPELTLDVFNLTNRRVNDIEYFYASRLPGEADAVDDRHVHPAQPRTVRLTLRMDW